MIFATTTRFNRYVFAALPLLALLQVSAGCSDNGGTGAGGSGGSGGSGGAGGSGATGGSGGASGAGGAGGSSGSGGRDGGGGTGLNGAFIVTLKNEPAPAFTNFVGSVYDGPQPPGQVLKLDSEEAGCQLWVPKVPFCAGGCTGGVCVDDSTCVFYPTVVGLGTAHVTGFKGGELTVPQPDTKIYQLTPTLPANACDEGAVIGIVTDKFSLQGKCVAPLELTAGPMDKIAVKSGQPVKILWKAPGQTGISRVQIHLDIAHHGGKKGEIDCDVPDTGSFDMPAALTTKLINLGLAGYPTIDVLRLSTAYAANEPNVKIQVGASLERDVDTGITSCTENADCPTGQTCQVDKTCK